MFSRVLTNDIRVSLSVPRYAVELFELTERNRAFLRQWLPWLDHVRNAEDTRDFLKQQLLRFAHWESLHLTIFYRDVIAGVVGYNSIDSTNGLGRIGYWLGEEFNGKGIMTTAVSDLITISREEYGLQKVEIHCATGNQKSRAIPQRLGFSHEGTLRRVERVYELWYDHEVYGLLL